jgi:predicted membrane protein
MSENTRPYDGPDGASRMADQMHRHADRIHRHADRVGERMRRRCGSGGGPPVFFGFVILVMGALFLLDNLEIIEARSIWRNFWPLLFIGWGASRLISGYGDRFLPLLAIGGGGLLIANRVLDWDVNVARIVWPVAMIAFGAHILYRSWRRPAVVHASGAADPASFGAAEPGTASADVLADTSSTFRDSAMLGSIERRNVSQMFRGGEASAFMGSVEIDLRECRMASTEAVVDVSAFIGSVEIRIPRDWLVESRMSALLGSFEDLTAAPVEGSAKRLVVRGSAMMGSVEIRN